MNVRYSVYNHDSHTIDNCCVPCGWAARTDLSADKDCLAQKGFLGSEGSWLCTGTAGTLAPVREGMQSTEAAGKNQGRWHCAAWVAHCGGRHCGTWPEGWAGGYIRCVLAPVQAAALGREREEQVSCECWLSAQNSGNLLVFVCPFSMIKLPCSFGTCGFTILCADCEMVN